jgi:hypothetical protein
MKREPFLRLLRREAKDLELEFRVEKSAGKGSHYRVYLNGRFTVVQSGDLTPLMMKTIRGQLGLK